jgi:DNA-nicking Smr family endonuclease
MHADEPPVPLPITGELDLHTFRPGDVSTLIPAYLAECRVRGIFSVRIVHGKGTGALRETVHALLRNSPLVQGFRLGDETSGGWGATIVALRRHDGEKLKG